MRAKFFKNPKIQLLIIIILIGIAYSNIFQNGFQGDDYGVLLNWDFVHHLENIPRILTQNVLPEPYSRFRPVGYSLIAVYYHFFGSNPLGYHFYSIVSHIIQTILVYLIAVRVVGSRFTVHGRENQPVNSELSARRTVNYLPFITALIFGLHPIQTESVTHVIVSLDGTGYIFFLASFWSYLRYSQYDKKKKWYWASVILAVLAFFSYELTLTLPLVIVLYELCFTNYKLQTINYKLLRYAPFFLSAFVYLAVRTFLLHQLSAAHYLVDSFYLTMLTMTKVFILYLTLLVAPVNLSISHYVLPGVRAWVDPFTNLDAIKAQSISQPEIVFNIGILGGLGILGIYFWKKIPLITFAIGWFFISLLPVSYILPQDGIIQERWLHLGVFSFGLIVGYIFDLTHLSFSRKRESGFPTKSGMTENTDQLILAVVLLILTSLYIYRIHVRNRDWKDDVSMYSSLVAQTPNSILDNYLLAASYDNQNKPDLALKYYQRTLVLEPNVVNVYRRMAKIYDQKGDIGQALENYKKTLLLTPNDLEATAQMARLQLKDSKTFTVMTENGYVGLVINNSLFILYPQKFSTTKIADGVVLRDIKTGFYMSFVLESDVKESPESYLKTQNQNYGQLESQGLAQIPGFDQAYVKVWLEGTSTSEESKPTSEVTEVNKLEFFLFKGDKVVKILVFPASPDSSEMKIFEDVVKSLNL